MRHLIFLICVVGTGSLSAQDYIPFPDSIATWKVSFNYEEEGSGNNFNKSYHLEGDTVIGGVEYSLFYCRPSGETWFADGQSFYTPDTNTPYELIGALREEPTKKVWYRNFYQGEAVLYGTLNDELQGDIELLLFDFDLQIGDSMQFSPAGDSPLYLHVLDITSDSQTGRPVLEFEQGYRWIEGIGGEWGGLFSRFVYQPWNVSGISTSLSCFTENGENIYGGFGGTYNCEGFANSLEELQLVNLNVYPNPTTGELRVELPFRLALTIASMGWGQPWQIQLFDALGRSIPGSRFETEAITSSDRESIILDLHSLPSGSYILRLMTDEAVFSARILKE